jgi:replicative DNA helicase
MRQDSKQYQNKRGKSELNLQTISDLQVPEHNLEIEKAIIGQIILERDCFQDVVKRLTVEDFYSGVNQTIYRCMVEMFSQNKPIELFSVVAELTNRDQLEYVGGAYYLTKCQDNVTSSVHLLNHCRYIKLLSIKRRIGVVCGTRYHDSFRKDISAKELLEGLQMEIAEISDSLVSGQEMIWSTAVEDAIMGSIKASDNPDDLLGLSSGISKIDKQTWGFMGPDLIIIAARPGCGKTTLALNMALNMAEAGVPIGFFSYEMNARQLVWKVLSRKLRVSVKDVQRGRLTEAQKSLMMRLGNPISRIPFLYNDSSSLTIMELRAQAQGWVRKNGCKIIFIDYIQLIKTYGVDKKMNREQEVSYISGQLKTLAKDLNIPVIALAQLNREADKAKQPKLSDLRESGSIEQDADAVLFIYDDPDVDFNDEIERSGISKPVIIDFAKFRLGQPGFIKMKFDRKCSEFNDGAFTPQGYIPLAEVEKF